MKLVNGCKKIANGIFILAFQIVTNNKWQLPNPKIIHFEIHRAGGIVETEIKKKNSRILFRNLNRICMREKNTQQRLDPVKKRAIERKKYQMKNVSTWSNSRDGVTFFTMQKRIRGFPF